MRSTPKHLLTALALLAGAAAVAAAQAPAPEEAAKLFSRGKAQAEANCADCTGSSAAALEEGLAAIRRAVEMGYPDRAAAWRLLAESYGALAWAFAEPGSPEQQAAVAEQREAYERWLEVEPQNTQALYDYAFTFTDADERLAVLERLLAVDPEHGEGLFAVGQIELEKGRVEEGLDTMRRAFDAARFEVAKELGERLLAAYEERGMVEPARAVRRRLAEIKAELRRLERGGEPDGAPDSSDGEVD